MKMISIDEVLLNLKSTDLRTARKWCVKNDVEIIKQGKNEFVFETEFKEVLERPFINKLKRKFGKEWESVYKLYAEGNILALNILQNMPTVNYKTYKPGNEIISKYLSKYENNEKTKAA